MSRSPFSKLPMFKLRHFGEMFVLSFAQGCSTQTTRGGIWFGAAAPHCLRSSNDEKEQRFLPKIRSWAPDYRRFWSGLKRRFVSGSDDSSTTEEGKRLAGAEISLCSQRLSVRRRVYSNEQVHPGWKHVIGDLLEWLTGCSVFIYFYRSAWLIQMNVAVLLPINHLCSNCKTNLSINLIHNEGFYYHLICIYGPAAR